MRCPAMILITLSSLLMIPVLALASSHAEDLTEAETTFTYLWDRFQQTYSLFEVKRVEWEALRRIYQPLTVQCTTPDDLFEVLARLLGHLNDYQVTLRTPDREFRSGKWAEAPLTTSSSAPKRPVGEVVINNYLRGIYKVKLDGVFIYGWLGDYIGYVCIRKFEHVHASSEAIEQILLELAEAKALILDIRGNPGGDHQVGLTLAARFADRRRLCLMSRERKGGQSEFTEPRLWILDPEGLKPFTHPIVLLTDNQTVGAAENFTLALRTLPHVSIMGEATAGSNAETYTDTLPNGWHVTVPYTYVTDHRGFCWEGLGIQPDIYVPKAHSSLSQGRDKVLEFALDYLRTGSPSARRDEPESVEPPVSLAHVMERELTTHGVEEGWPIIENLIAEQGTRLYAHPVDCVSAAENLRRLGKAAEANKVLAYAVQRYSELWWVHGKSGEALLVDGRVEPGLAAIHQAQVLNPRGRPNDISEYYRYHLLESVFQDGASTAFAQFQELMTSNDSRYLGCDVALAVSESLMAFNKPQESLAFSSQALAVYPTSAKLYRRIATTYWHMGRKNEALDAINKAMNLEPDDLETRDLQHRIANELLITP